MDVKEMTDKIEQYVRPATFPVGIKMLKPGEVFPPKYEAVWDIWGEKKP